jgi:hypothetical protein
VVEIHFCITRSAIDYRIFFWAMEMTIMVSLVVIVTLGVLALAGVLIDRSSDPAD